MTEKKKTRPTYSAEFRAEAVAKCLKIGVSQTSKELGVSPVTLKNWVLKANRGPKIDGKPSYEDLEKEVRKLKKELGYVNDINKIVKKSTAIFSSSELGGLR